VEATWQQSIRWNFVGTGDQALPSIFTPFPASVSGTILTGVRLTLLYRLKFQKDKSVVNEIVETVAQFVQGTWRPPISMIVPMPPSNIRAEQPVAILAEALAERLAWPVRHAVTKIKKTEQLKDIYDYDERMRTLEGAFSADPSLLSEQRVLLFDDLCRSGATMSSVATALREQGKAMEVYALTLTRTRVNR
jgi:competence protein ComFC